MRLRTKWIIVGVLSLTGMVACLYFSSPRQPEHQGRPLQDWLADLANPHHQTQQVARAAIRAMGPAAVPFLEQSLDQRTSLALRMKRHDIIPKRMLNLGRRVVKWQNPMMESRNAAIALQSVGPAATNAIPSLVAALSDPSWAIAQSSAAALASLGSNAVPALGKRLQRAKGEELHWVVHALGIMGQQAAPLAPQLSELLTSSNKALADSVSLVLHRIGADAVPSITNLLVNPDTAVQVRALRTLTHIPGNLSNATPSVLALMHSDNADVRLHARQVFASMLPGRDLSYPIWLEGLRDPDPRNVETSLRALTIFPTNVRTFNREIASLTGHPTNSIREVASNALTLFKAWPSEN